MLNSIKEFDLMFLNLPSYTKTLDRIMGQVFREAARAWLRHILTSGVPVETGMAKAALIPVGRVISGVAGLSVNPIRQPYYSKLEGGIQYINFGIRKTNFVFNDDKTNPGKYLYTFEWSTEVLHYWLEQYYKGPATVGEHLVKEAEVKFDNALIRIPNRLPHFADYIVLTRTTN